jgi:hypothetical protein
MASTTNKGLGWSHQKARAAMPPPHGDPCPFCCQPMWPHQRLHADHPTARVLGGGDTLRWAHGRCNESAGASLGNLLRRQRPLADTWANRWA